MGDLTILLVCSRDLSDQAILSLVEHFKFLSEKIGEKCFEFYRSFSRKMQVKNSKVFQQSHESSEKVINFSDTFQMKKSVKNEGNFSLKNSMKIWNCSTSDTPGF